MEMNTQYTRLPDHSRVWVYQSNREFTHEESVKIKNHAGEFLKTWNSHGAALCAVLEIFYNRFLVLFVDETHASTSGCSIDTSIHFFKQLEKELNVSLFDRMSVAYRKNGRIETVRLHELGIKFLNIFGKEADDVIVFNNLVSTKNEFLTHWEIPLKNSWVNSLLKS